jgi:hypothetical protein
METTPYTISGLRRIHLKRICSVAVFLFLILLIQVTVIQTQFIHAQNTVLSPKRVNGKITDGFLLLDHHPQVAVSGSNVYVVWVSHYSGNDEIYFTKSSNGGATFGSVTNLSNDPGDSYDPYLAIVGYNVYVMWVDGTPGPHGNPDILFRRSTNGSTFAPTINLSNNPGISNEPGMAVSQNKVYVVWRDNTLGTEEILFKRSVNGGASFDSTLYLTANSTKPINSVRPQIVANASNVFVVWSMGNFDQGRTDVLFKRSINGGASFGSTVNISNKPNSLSTLPKIFVLDHKIYVVWAEGPYNKKQILFKRSVDGGATFGNTTVITNATAGDSFNPQVSASNNNNVYLLWEYDMGNASKQLFFKRSVDGGATFGNTINIGGSSEKEPTNALLNSSGNNVYVTWVDNSTGHSQVFFRHSTDAGTTFCSILSLSNARGQSQYPDMTSFNNNVYGVWQDRISRSIGIFFERII